MRLFQPVSFDVCTAASLRLEVTGLQRGISCSLRRTGEVCALGAGERLNERRKWVYERPGRRTGTSVRVEFGECGRKRSGPETRRQSLCTTMVSLETLCEGGEEYPAVTERSESVQDLAKSQMRATHE